MRNDVLMMFKKDSLFCFYQIFYFIFNIGNCIGGVLVNMVGSSAVYNGVKPKTYQISICCFSTKHAALSKSKDWLTQNQDNMSGGVICLPSGHHHHVIEMYIN